MHTALGAAWDKLAEPLRRHYGLAGGADESLVLYGHMQVDYPSAALPLILAARLCGALVHRRGENIAVTVANSTRNGSPALFWHRTFAFPGKPVIFTSRMEHLAGNEVVEFVRCGLGIRLRLSECDGALVFHSNGYLWRLGPLRLTLPDWLLLGKAEIVEYAVGEERIGVDFTVAHPLWGQTFRYRGEFVFDRDRAPLAAS
jgi:hypothetical protein